MGEVYRARDAKLGREVAIKTLPQDLLEAEDRLGRFEREARVLATLNHPHIAAIYGLEEQDGRPFLVMELVEGEDLTSLIAAGGLGTERALEIASQLAHGLEAAHAHGIVHRDLKPDNVRITTGGVAKILDFGLAKEISPEDPGSGISQLQTMSADATEAGVILGTASYMSPEQARGQAVDRRTDIWAFGCVLFEMLSGRKPFGGATVTDVLAAIVHEEPDWGLLPATTPWRVRNVLRRCLEKAQTQRLRDVGDARLELEDPSSPAAEASPTRFPWTVAVALAAVAAAAAGLAAWNLRPETRAPTLRIATTLPAGRDMALRSMLALSPDARHLAFPLIVDGQPSLYLRSVADLETRPIADSGVAISAFFSPDGEWVGYFNFDSLHKARVSGGAPIKIAEHDVKMQTLASTMARWGSEDTIYYPSNVILATPAGGGESRTVTTRDEARGELLHYWPEPLPGEHALLYCAVVAPSGRNDIMAVDLSTGATSVVVEGASSPRYTASGHLLFARDDRLFAVDFDPASLQTAGTPVAVLEDIQVDQFGPIQSAQYDVTPDGSLAYIEARPSVPNGQLVWVSHSGSVEPLATEPSTYLVPRVSPGGRRVAVATLDPETGQRDIWNIDLDRAVSTRLTFGEGISTDPVWTPDGGHITFASTRLGPFNFFQLAADGSGEPSLVGERREQGLAFPRFWLPDGSGLVFQEVGGDRMDVTILRTGADPGLTPLLDSQFSEQQPTLSPDGRWLAYVSDETARREIYVRSFPEGERRWLVSNDGGEEPLWSPTRPELYYRSGDRMMRVPFVRDPQFEPSSPELVFRGSYQRDPFGNDARNYDIDPSGERFLMIESDTSADKAGQLNLVFNWFDEVERLLEE